MITVQGRSKTNVEKGLYGDAIQCAVTKELVVPYPVMAFLNAGAMSPPNVTRLFLDGYKVCTQAVFNSIDGLSRRLSISRGDHLKLLTQFRWSFDHNVIAAFEYVIMELLPLVLERLNARGKRVNFPDGLLHDLEDAILPRDHIVEHGANSPGHQTKLSDIGYKHQIKKVESL